MPDLDLTITIASWNTREILRSCLQSLEAVRDEAAIEVVVFDNASEDGSPDMVRDDFPAVTLLKSDANLGFGAAHNRAMAVGGGRFFMPFNSDALMLPGAIPALLQFAQERPKAGFIGPKIQNPDGSLQYSCRRFPTIEAALFRNTFLGRLFPNNRFTREYLMQEWPHDEPRQVDWLSAAAVMVRREMVEQIGGFDERFFMYCEDVDWCLRAHEAGWENWYVPSAVVKHTIGRSTDIVANKMIRVFHKSMWLFYKKHYIHKVPLLVRPLIPLGLWLRGSLYIVKNHWDALRRRFAR